MYNFEGLLIKDDVDEVGEDKGLVMIWGIGGGAGNDITPFLSGKLSFPGDGGW